jgi:hypothetical protein
MNLCIKLDFPSHMSDARMVQYLKDNGYTVEPITICSMAELNNDFDGADWHIRKDHVLLISQQFLKGEASWIVVYGDELMHNFQRAKLHPLEFINRPILTAYVVYHPKWNFPPSVADVIEKQYAIKPKRKKLAVVGSRTFDDKVRLYEILTKNYDRIKMIVSGGARGADTLAVEWATDFGIPYLVFPAAWRDPFTGAHDKGAGFRRNRYIVDNCDVVMAFWDGVSGGTAHTIKMAQEAGKPVRIIKFVAKPEPVSSTSTHDSPEPVGDFPI